MNRARGTESSSPGSSAPWIERARDLRLDWIRGYAIFAVTINHAGMQSSWLHELSGRSVFLVNGAEVFFAVSGFTLGVVARGAPRAEATGRLWRRALVVWATVVAVTAIAGLLRPLGDGGGLAGGEEMLGVVLRAVLLQEALAYSNVLVHYVVYLLAAVLAVRALHGGRPWVVLGATAVVYATSQLAPGLVPPLVGSFRDLAANVAVFFVPIVLGWHREEVAAWWRERRPVTRWVDAVLATCAVGLLVVYASGFRLVPALAGPLGYEVGALDGGVLARQWEMPPAALLAVVLYLWAIWRLVSWGWRPLRATLGWFTFPQGRASLFAFAVHGFVIEAWLRLPGHPGEGATGLRATAWVAGVALAVWALCVARNAVAARVRALPRPWPRRCKDVAPLVGAVAVAAVTVVAGAVAGG